MWRYVVSKIINWWYWLAIFGFIFIVGNNVYATSYFENFDGFASSTPVKTISGGNWIGSGIISPIHNYSYPNGAYGTTTPGYLRFLDNANGISTTSVYVYWNNTNVENTIFFETIAPGILFAFDLNSGSTYYNARLLSLAGSDVNIKGKSVLANNTWYHLQVEFASSTGYLRYNWNDEGWSSKINAGEVSSLGIVRFDTYGNANGLNIDDFSTNGGVVGSSVKFLNPTNNFPLNIYNYSAPITSSNYFNWNVDYTIGETIITTYPSDIPQILIQYVNASSSVVNTVTMANTNLSFSFYTPGETYNVTSNDITDFPTQTGIYTAEVDLWRTHLRGGQRYYDDILASSTIQFIIATSTPITGNTAWCSDLCADLDLGTATSSSFWSGLVPNLLNNGICAIRYGACYLFWPDSTVIAQLSNTYDNFKVSFPFNVYYDLASTTQNALATSTNMTGTFKMPFVTTSGQATTITVLSSSSIPNLIGQTNSNLFRTTAGYLIWLITAGGIAFMAFTIL